MPPTHLRALQPHRDTLYRRHGDASDPGLDESSNDQRFVPSMILARRVRASDVSPDALAAAHRG